MFDFAGYIGIVFVAIVVAFFVYILAKNTPY